MLYLCGIEAAKAIDKGLETNIVPLMHYRLNMKLTNKERYTKMATTIKAIPTLKGKEAREFLRHAEEAERNYIFYDYHTHQPKTVNSYLSNTQYKLCDNFLSI